MTSAMSALRNPILVGLRADLAADIGLRQSTPAADRLLDILTVAVVRAYTMICRGDGRYPILGRAVDGLWRAAEKICCQEAQKAARAVMQPTLSQQTKTAAGIELASFVTDTLKISMGTIPRSIRDKSAPAELARIDQFDYFIGATQELLSGRWDRPGIISPGAYIRSALIQEAHRYYAAKIEEQRFVVSTTAVRGASSPAEFSPGQVIAPVDLERGLAVLRAAGMQDDLATLIVERYLRHRRPGDVGVDQEAAQELGWTPERLERVQAALRRGWGARIRDWFEAGCYRPRKKLKNRVGSRPEISPFIQ